MCGISEHHMRHPGTLTLRPGTFLTVLGDMIDSMARAGFRNIVVVNGHGGNIEPIRGTWDQFPAAVRRHEPAFFVLLERLARRTQTSCCVAASGLPDNMPGHAQEFETALQWPSS